MLRRTREAGGAHRIQVIAWKGFFRAVFGTATPSTCTSETSPRGEEGFYRHFGTGTLPTDASVASSRSNCELVFRIVAELGFVKFTWHEPLLIIK